MKRPLNSQQLGTQGEREFPSLCADLVLNDSGEDMAGWDYIVDLPNEKIGDMEFPDRPDDPLSAKVQLKTIWDDNQSIKLPLKSAQRLAAYSGPAFLVVLKINHQLQITSFSVAHVFDEILEKILNRLTNESGKQNLNNKSITFRDNDNWKKLDFRNKRAFAEYLENTLKLLEPSVRYVSEKASQRENLGVDHDQNKLTFQLSNLPISDIEDAFLGLKPVKVENGAIFETRFGEERKIRSLPLGTTFVAVAGEGNGRTGVLKLTTENQVLPISLFGNIMIPPFPHPGSLESRCRFLSGAFSMIFTFGKQLDFRLSVDADKIQSIKSWMQQIKFISSLADKNPKIKMMINGSSHEADVIRTKQLMQYTKIFSEIPDALDRIHELADRFSISNFSFSLTQLFEFNCSALEAYYLTSEPSVVMKLVFGLVDGDAHEGEMRIIIVRRLRFLDIDLVYACSHDVLSTFEDQKQVFYLKKHIGFDVLPFESYSQKINVEDWEKLWDCQNTILDSDSGLTPKDS